MMRFDDRAAFNAALDGPMMIDFDDVDTSAEGRVEIASDRYADRGILIDGDQGFFVDEDFNNPSDYPPVSEPNVAAPGDNTTTVTFTSAVDGAVDGFGVTFIDADFPNLGPSSITLFDAAGAQITEEQITTENGEGQFIGFIMEEGEPDIDEVRLVTGSGDPTVEANEGVVLDNMVFAGQEVFTLSPGASLLRTSSRDEAEEPVVLDLSELGFAAGDTIRIATVGDFARVFGRPDEEDDLNAVFSSTEEVLGESEEARIPGAIDAGEDVETGRSFIGDLETDIPEDFAVTSDGVDVTVPGGAEYLIIGVDDNLFEDNVDPDEDLGFSVTAAPDSQPEPDPLPEPDPDTDSGLKVATGFFEQGSSFAEAINGPADAAWFKILDAEQGGFVTEGASTTAGDWVNRSSLSELALTEGRYFVKSWGPESRQSDFQSGNIAFGSQESFVEMGSRPLPANGEVNLSELIDTGNLTDGSFVRVLVTNPQQDFGFLPPGDLAEGSPLTVDVGGAGTTLNVWVDVFLGERSGWSRTEFTAEEDVSTSAVEPISLAGLAADDASGLAIG